MKKRPPAAPRPVAAAMRSASEDGLAGCDPPAGSGASNEWHDLDDLDGRFLARTVEGLIAVQEQSRLFVALLQERPQRAPIGSGVSQRLGDDVVAGGFDDGNGGFGGEIVGVVGLEAGQRLEGGEHAQAVLAGKPETIAAVGSGWRQRRRLVAGTAQP